MNGLVDFTRHAAKGPERRVRQQPGALGFGDLLEGLLKQVQGAGAITAITSDGALTLAADGAGGELDGQGVDPGGVQVRLAQRLGIGPFAGRRLRQPDACLGVGHGGAPVAQADPGQATTGQGLGVIAGQLER